ncbi:uncharacterized protein LOC128882538 [Hylaeus volcanicus]|uniref:uncharacterized protein LOC128882538 n=1 Tax=Hylaeus volcanicus TaxID=313075 RepID=UPI0023B84A1F|nr:uncharacterized protein LOC128882538 [Hylaeus volcanicus]
MAQSGLTIPSDVLQAFTSLKIERKFKYMIIHVNEKNISYKTAETTATFSDFSREFDAKLACYGIYDSESKKKLVLVHWNPNDAPVKNRMLVSTTLKALQDSLHGLANAQQVTDLTELKNACL